jgi:hypothetical protein
MSENGIDIIWAIIKAFSIALTIGAYSSFQNPARSIYMGIFLGIYVIADFKPWRY